MPNMTSAIAINKAADVSCMMRFLKFLTTFILDQPFAQMVTFFLCDHFPSLLV